MKETLRKETFQMIEDAIYEVYVNEINAYNDTDALEDWKANGLNKDIIWTTMNEIAETTNGYTQAMRFDGKKKIMKAIDEIGNKILKENF